MPRIAMEGFDYFAMQVQEAKTSHPASYHMLIGQLPESEFALVVKSSAGAVHAWPMHNPQAHAAASARFEQERDRLPPAVAMSVQARLAHRSQELGAKTSEEAEGLDPSAVYWSSEEEHFIRRQLRRQRREKEASAPSPQRHEHPVIAAWSLAHADNKGVKVSFVVRKRSDLNDAIHFFEKSYAKLSSSDRRRMALGIRRVYEEMGLDLRDSEMLSKISSVVRTYGGKQVRWEAVNHLQDRARMCRQGHGLAKQSSTRQKAEQTYEKLAVALEAGEDPEKIAHRTDILDSALHLDVVPAHEAVFCGMGEYDVVKQSVDDFRDDPVYTHRELIIRQSDLEKLPLIPLQRLENLLGEEVIVDLRNDPVAAFKKLDADQRKIVAHYVGDKIKNERLHHGAGV